MFCALYMWRSFVYCSFYVIVFFGYFLFSLFLFLHGLHPLDRVYHSFFYSFFFITKIERNFTLYTLKKKRKKRKRTSITKGRKLWYSIVYLFQPWPNFQILTLPRLPSIRLNTRPPRLQLRTTILRHRNVSSAGVGKSVLHVEKKGEPAGAIHGGRLAVVNVIISLGTVEGADVITDLST